MARKITFQGKTLSLTAWAKAYGLPRSTLYARLEDGVDFKTAVMTPKGKLKRRKIKIYDRDYTADEIAKIAKIAKGTVYSRLAKGWKKEELLIENSARLLTMNGETHSLSEWARIKGLSVDTLTTRLCTYGWSVEEALTTPKLRNGVKKKLRTLEAFGQKKALCEWADDYKIKPKTLKKRLRNGMDLETALRLPVEKRTRRNESG